MKCQKCGLSFSDTVYNIHVKVCKHGSEEKPKAINKDEVKKVINKPKAGKKK